MRKRSRRLGGQPRPDAATRTQKLPEALDVSIGQLLHTLLGFGDLEDTPEIRAAFPFQPRFVPQTRDLFNLFDTTPDLFGADVDIGPFVRDGEDLDVLVFWRDDTSGLGPDDMWKSGPRAGCPFKRLLPARHELCPVPVWRFRDFFRNLGREHKGQVWVRDWRKGWVKVDGADRIYPGQLCLLHANVGGYNDQIGWSGRVESVTRMCHPGTQTGSLEPQDISAFGESALEDEDNAVAAWQSVQEHSVAVAHELGRILNDAEIAAPLAAAGLRTPLESAPPWHDLGKAHGKFLAKLTREARENWNAPRNGDHPAKAPSDAWKSFFHEREDQGETDVRFVRRRGFRHELASALGLLEMLRAISADHPALTVPEDLKAGLSVASNVGSAAHGDAIRSALEPIGNLDRLSFNLLLFLVACHHGKVRLGLRSTEDDHDPAQLDPVPGRAIRRCQGVQDRDTLPPCRLPDPGAPIDADSEIVTPEVMLSLDVMELYSARYGASWADRMRELVEVFGPFNVGYLEALLRAADQRASAAALTLPASNGLREI